MIVYLTVEGKMKEQLFCTLL